MLLLLVTIQAQFILRLRSHHPDIWRALGEPSCVLGLSSRPWTVSARINHYFTVQEFQSIDNDVTRRLGERLWRIRRWFLGYSFSAAAMVLVFLGFAKWRAV